MTIYTKFAIGIVSFTSLLISTGFAATPTLAETEKVAFYCGRTQDGNLYPATMIGVSGREREPWTIVVWKNRSGNVTPQQRCDTVSRRFQAAWDRHEFNHLVAGTEAKSGRGLICAVRDRNSVCDASKMLFTVNNRQNAREIIQGLYEGMRKTGNPTYQASSNESIDMQELINSLGKSTR
jgi:Circadian oscillating protein COP23